MKNTILIALAVLLLLNLTAVLGHDNNSPQLTARVAALESLLQHFSRNGNDVLITGANLNVVNGTGTTDGDPNSLGNVIIGYNERRQTFGTPGNPGEGLNIRTGSHMLVVGKKLNYSRFGGIVVGQLNAATGDYSSVSGGHRNLAAGNSSSVSGGFGSTASDSYTSVSGGYLNEATGYASSLSGGYFNVADGPAASVTGGVGNTASGMFSSVSGGVDVTATGLYAHPDTHN